jgi:hypothetical protein
MADMLLLSSREAAAYLGVSMRYLQTLRIAGGGPRFTRLPNALGGGAEKSIRYLRRELVRWAEARPQYSNTTDADMRGGG